MYGVQILFLTCLWCHNLACLLYWIFCTWFNMAATWHWAAKGTVLWYVLIRDFSQCWRLNSVSDISQILSHAYIFFFQWKFNTRLRVYSFEPILFTMAFFFGMFLLLTHSSENGRLGMSPKPSTTKSRRFSRRFSRLLRDLRFVSKLAVLPAVLFGIQKVCKV